MSLMHISKTSINIFDTFVFLNMFAEWTVTHLHICKFILILSKELTTIFTHINCNIRNNILEVALWIVWVKVAVILNINFFKP